MHLILVCCDVRDINIVRDSDWRHAESNPKLVLSCISGSIWCRLLLVNRVVQWKMSGFWFKFQWWWVPWGRIDDNKSRFSIDLVMVWWGSNDKSLPAPVLTLCTDAFIRNSISVSTLRPIWNGQHFADDIFKRVFFFQRKYLNFD